MKYTVISKSVKTENVIFVFLNFALKTDFGYSFKLASSHNLRIGAKIRLKRLLHVPQLILTKTCVFTAAKFHGCNSMILTVEFCPNIIYLVQQQNEREFLICSTQLANGKLVFKRVNR